MLKRSWLLFLLLPALALAQGITWGPQVRVDDAPGASGHPAVHPYTIIDDSLNIYSLWEDDRDQNDTSAICFARSVDLGSSFSSSLIICSDSLYNAYPWIVRGKGGNIYLAWQVRYQDSYWRIYLSRSTDGGQTFSVPDTVKGVVVRNNQDSEVNRGPMPKIAIDPGDSILYLVWVNGEGADPTRVACAKSTDGGAGFFGQVIVNADTTKPAKNPDVATDVNGQVFVVYEQSNSGISNNDWHPLICTNQSNNYGAAFQANHDTVCDDFTAGARRLKPSITRVPGRCLVIWEDSRMPPATDYSRPHLFFSQKYDTAANYTPNLWVSKGCGEWNYRPRVDIDRTNGNLVVAWHSSVGTDSTRFEIRMSAYSDSSDSFGISYKMFDTYTGLDATTYGYAFYPPAMTTANIGTVTNFFLVWQDLAEDIGGNIYSRRGWVVTSQVDLDIFPDALDAVGDSLNFGTLPAGPAWVSRSFRLANTGSGINPDSLDGPSTAVIDSLAANGITLHNVDNPSLTLTAGFIESPETFPDLNIGQTLDVTVTLYVPEGTPAGRYVGYAKLRAVGNDLTVDTDSIRIVVQGPSAAADLESLRVFPNPFKYWLGHRTVNFEGLTPAATLKIYDIKGRLLATIEENNGDGLATWTPKAASGVYLWSVSNPQGQKKTGKIAILR
jgi:hypothetical protein